MHGITVPITMKSGSIFQSMVLVHSKQNAIGPRKVQRLELEGLQLAVEDKRFIRGTARVGHARVAMSMSS